MELSTDFTNGELFDAEPQEYISTEARSVNSCENVSRYPSVRNTDTILRTWAIDFNITHRALKGILEIIQLNMAMTTFLRIIEPRNVTEYLTPFVDELTSLLSKGVSINI